eukprot:261254-Prymnesium_polylepis.1
MAAASSRRTGHPENDPNMRSARISCRALALRDESCPDGAWSPNFGTRKKGVCVFKSPPGGHFCRE